MRNIFENLRTNKIGEIMTAEKPLKKCESGFYKEILQANRQNFIITYSGSKVILNYGNTFEKEKVFTDYDKNRYLHILKKMKKELINSYLKEIEKKEKNVLFHKLCKTPFFTHQKQLKNIKKIDITYIGFSDKIKLIENKELLQIDINSAYIFAALKLGYISKELFEEIEGEKTELKNSIADLRNKKYFLNISQKDFPRKNEIKNIIQRGKINMVIKQNELCLIDEIEKLNELKYAALMAIGSIAKTVNTELHEFCQETKKYKISMQTKMCDSHIIRQHICYEIDKLMQECIKKGALLYWCDAILINPKHKKIFTDFFTKEGYQYKIEKFICNFVDNKLHCKNADKNKYFNLIQQ